jgi:hypothetical protein
LRTRPRFPQVGDLVSHGGGRFLAFTTGLAIAAGTAALMAGLLPISKVRGFESRPCPA